MGTEANRRCFSLKGAFLRCSFLKKISLIVPKSQPESPLSARMRWGRRKTSLMGFTRLRQKAPPFMAGMNGKVSLAEVRQDLWRTKAGLKQGFGEVLPFIFRKPRDLSRGGFTLIELIVVVIITAILVSLAVPQYIKTIERAKEKEAVANLKLMQAAQKIYKLEQGFFYPDSGGPSIDEINENLRLDLNENQWIYNTPATGTDDEFSATANRDDWKARTYSIDQDMTEPDCSGPGCP